MSASKTCRRFTTCTDTSIDAIFSEIGYAANTGLVLPETQTVRAGDGSVSATTTNGYDAQGNLISVNGPLPGNADTTRHAYNANREPIATVSPDPDGSGGPLKPAATRIVRDSMGRVILEDTGTVDSVTDTALTTFASLNRTATRYDGMGRPVLVASAANGATYSVVETNYDALSRPVCSVVRMNPSLFPAVGANGLITGGSLPVSPCSLGTQGAHGPDRITRSNYDIWGQTESIERAVGTADQITYARYTYDENGNQRSVTDANGNRSEFTYDGHDRLIRWTFPSETMPGVVNANDYEAYGYDDNGNRVSLRKRDGRTINYTFDQLDRMQIKDVPGTADDVYHGYQLQGEMLEALFGSVGGDGIVNSYDQLGRLTSSANSTGGTARTLTYGYDEAGNRLLITHPDGQEFHYSYDNLYRPRRIRQSTASGTRIADITYNNLGQRAVNDPSGGPDTLFAYDAANRLSSLTQDLAGTANDLTLGFAYNAAGQVVTRTMSNQRYRFDDYRGGEESYTVNGLNQYESVAGVSFTHDANGNLTSDGENTYLYDIENRLISVTGEHAATLSYDPLGRLFSVAGGSSGDRQFLYDGDALVAEYAPSGSLLDRYIHGAGPDEPLVWYEGSAVSNAARRQLLADHQGSIVAVTDNGGNLIRANRYDSWGRNAPANLGRFRYTGQI
ncbi:MAG: hypothetical protein LC634_07410, partial [Sphingomonadales bacterium]|nr:hypothetical protein [Sphingomonadales bacterium]